MTAIRDAFTLLTEHRSHRSSLLSSAVEPVTGQPLRPSRPPLRPVASGRTRGPETCDPEMDGAALREMVNVPLPPPEEGWVENLLFPFFLPMASWCRLQRCMNDWGFSVRDLHSDLSDDELDALVSDIHASNPRAGYRMMLGLLRAQGH
ncbi:hypothetical protein ROHU_012103 [Labeo rohita]|uniref:Uncharacterized protein n=1 Tax=Labeo rohita TaxID=84645 RepID=A0A498LFQ1_LABRO|nr:hypothetical protein ROHU_012103 [Labeo rohita]